LVSNFQSEGSGYTLSLVTTNGQVAASASAHRRSTFIQIGSLSTSATTLYYLDGDSEVRSLKPDGTAGIATQIKLGPNQQAAFAVSPDDRRIAVSVLDYTRYPVGTRLYVEDLRGGLNHIELFSSSTVLEWPAGWHNGRLVIALGINAPPQNAGEWFERGRGYHVADAQTGIRYLSLCDEGGSNIPESPAGTVCVRYPNGSVVSWDGADRPVPKDGPCVIWGPLSPSGVMASREINTGGGNCTSGDKVFLITTAGDRDPRSLAKNSSPEGWIDSSHLVVLADIPLGSPTDFQPVRSIVDTSTGLTSTAQGQGFFAAALPGGL
jgi:hypothetical protein